MVAGCRMREWARHCLVELAGNGASLEELRAFCEKRGIPGRRKQYWGISTWANTRLRELHAERESLVTASRKASGPPQLDAATAMDYRQADKLLRQGGQAQRKQLLRTLVGEVKLMSQDLEVCIRYRPPEAAPR